MAFLDPAVPGHLPRGFVAWPLFAALALSHVPYALHGEEESRVVVVVAVCAQLATLVLAIVMSGRLFATGAVRARVVRIIVLSAAATASSAFTAATAHAPMLRWAEWLGAALAAFVFARAIAGWKDTV